MKLRTRRPLTRKDTNITTTTTTTHDQIKPTCEATNNTKLVDEDDKNQSTSNDTNNSRPFKTLSIIKQKKKPAKLSSSFKILGLKSNSQELQDRIKDRKLYFDDIDDFIIPEEMDV